MPATNTHNTTIHTRASSYATTAKDSFVSLPCSTSPSCVYRRSNTLTMRSAPLL